MLDTISRDLTNQEQIFKSVYLNYPKLHLDECLTSKKLEDIIKDLPQWQPFIPQFFSYFSDTESFSELIIPQGLDVYLMRHDRYLPCGIHSHDFFEMIYVLDGTCSNFIAKKELHMKTGDLCLLSPHNLHAIKAFSDEAIIINIFIRNSTFQKAFFGVFSNMGILSSFFSKALYSSKKDSYLLFETGHDLEIHDIILRLYHESQNQRRYSAQLLNSLITTLFILLLQNHQPHTMVPNPSGNKNQSDIMLILNYILSNYKTLNLSELSQFFNYSERQMARILHDYTGNTFLEIINDVRLQHVCDLLENSDIPVFEIIDAVGYSNTTHFYSIFKKQFHMTPAEWRLQHKDNMYHFD